MTAYYNENDPFAAAWLRELIKAGLIAPGDVDERDIRDVRPTDLRGYIQCHFFAGIGVWSYALRRAGWPDDRHVWTGSCPCQPFSAAGKGSGFADERHLWPAWFHLIGQCRPPVIFGEQVASRDGLGWLDLVHADLEGAGYASGAVDLCAAGVGAPHIRQRLWFVADAAGERWNRGEGAAWTPGRDSAENGGSVSGLANANRGQRIRFADGEGREPNGAAAGRQQGDGQPASSGELCSVAHAQISGRREERADAGGSAAGGGAQGLAAGSVPGGAVGRLEHSGGERWERRQGAAQRGVDDGADAGRAEGDNGSVSDGETGDGPRSAGPTNGLWRAADWLLCRDGKWRPVEPGTFPLAHGATARVGRLRGYGNAINAEAARQVIAAYMER